MAAGRRCGAAIDLFCSRSMTRGEAGSLEASMYGGVQVWTVLGVGDEGVGIDVEQMAVVHR